MSARQRATARERQRERERERARERRNIKEKKSGNDRKVRMHIPARLCFFSFGFFFLLFCSFFFFCFFFLKEGPEASFCGEEELRGRADSGSLAAVSGSCSTGVDKALEIKALEIVGRREGPLFLLGQVYN